VLVGSLATVRSPASLAGGLDHLFNLGKNPLAPFRVPLQIPTFSEMRR